MHARIHAQSTRLKPVLVPAPSVLCYGHHETLLYTRQQLLRQMGYAAESVSTSAEYWAYLLQNSPGVIVLCQTLTAHECDDAVHLAADQRPETRMLIMYTRTQPSMTSSMSSSLAAFDGPKAFGQTVAYLLQDWPN